MALAAALASMTAASTGERRAPLLLNGPISASVGAVDGSEERAVDLSDGAAGAAGSVASDDDATVVSSVSVTTASAQGSDIRKFEPLSRN